MKRIMNPKVFLSILIVAGLTMACTSKNVIPIKDIDVDKHLDQYVTVEGLVTQYTPKSAANVTPYYILKGEYGWTIQVNTSSKQPIINRKYRVKGIVKAEVMTDQAYLVEIEKRMIIPLWIFVAGGAILLIILAVVLILTLGNRRSYESSSHEQPDYGAHKGPKPEDPTSSGQREEKEEDYKYDEEFPTIQIVTNSYDLTLKDIPGHLIALDGEEQGKPIKLRGRNRDGVVTIGKLEKTGKDRATHMRINEGTVSRQQAEIIVTANHKVLVKNLSKVNYTQLNGEEIMVDETRELNSGDKLKFGNRMFEYQNS